MPFSRRTCSAAPVWPGSRSPCSRWVPRWRRTSSVGAPNEPGDGSAWQPVSSLGQSGALGVVVAAVIDSPALLFVAFFVYGAGTSTNLQARYAGTDLAPADQRATAVSIAMVSTTFGAVAGPNLVELMGRVAITLGIPPLAGPFLLAGVAYGLAGAILFVFLRPDPYLVAMALERRTPSEPTPQRSPDREGRSTRA